MLNAKGVSRAGANFRFLDGKQMATCENKVVPQMRAMHRLAMCVDRGKACFWDWLYLNQFKKGSLIGAVADQKPPTAVAERTNGQKLEPAASASGEA
jgi:hypothetical protein